MTLREAGAWGEDGREVAAFAEAGVALLHGCVAVVLEVLEGGGAVGGTEGGGHTGNMASVSVTAEGGGRGEGRAPGPPPQKALKTGGEASGPRGHLWVLRGFLQRTVHLSPWVGVRGWGRKRVEEIVDLFMP